MARTLLLIISLLMEYCVGAQDVIVPREGARLHYRIIGFSISGYADSHHLQLEIAAGTYNDEVSFVKNIFIVQPGNGGPIIAEVPKFGQEYTWRIIGAGSGKTLYHFTTLSNPLTDSFVSLSISRSGKNFGAAYVFTDCSRALHDMDGRVVWFLPLKMDDSILPGGVQDLKATCAGTITYLRGTKMYETSFDGSLLRCISDSGLFASSRGEIHHDGTRLANGHYMMLGYESCYWKMTNGKVSLRRSPKDGYEMRIFGTVSEVDARGKLVWKFCPADHIISSDLMNRHLPDGRPMFDEHLNAFFFDSVNRFVYLGYRNVDRILKVSYPGGKVVAEIGARYGADGKPLTAELFCHQHSFTVSGDSIFLFDNNGCAPRPIPKIQFLVADTAATCGARVIWEYLTCQNELPVGRSSGGNIVMLPGGDVFTSLSIPYNDLIIVGRNKVEKWRATPMYRKTVSDGWQSMNCYRASILTSREAVYKLINNRFTQ